jgi:hypothetical protein
LNRRKPGRASSIIEIGSLVLVDGKMPDGSGAATNRREKTD